LGAQILGERCSSVKKIKDKSGSCLAPVPEAGAFTGKRGLSIRPISRKIFIRNIIFFEANGMSIIETINNRVSCRTYSDRPIEPAAKAALADFLKANVQSPFGSEIRFQLLDLDELEVGETRALKRKNLSVSDLFSRA
jgi:hypothetical protein